MYVIFEKLCQEHGVKTSTVAKATGINPTTFSEWKKGKYTPKDDKRQKIADFFGVSLAYLDGKEKATPIYDVSAGQGRINGEYATEYIESDTENGEYDWCVICGDSMLPELKDGDKVRVHHQMETTPQDLTVVKIDGESCTVKFVEIADNGVWLRALNKDVYPDTFYTIREVMTLPVKIIGKVTEVRREY